MLQVGQYYRLHRSSEGLRANIRTGFSLIELLVVIAIIGILMAFAVPAMMQAREAARKAKCINNLRNIGFALTQYDHFNNRLPPSGSFGHDKNLNGFRLHTWAVFILPHLDQGNLSDQINLDLPLDHPENSELQTAYIPGYICPMDISSNIGGGGDQSYVVNGGFGFTVKRGNVRDCPVDRYQRVLDLNGDGQGCTGDEKIDDLDKKFFNQTGLFFLETRNTDITKRHHSIADIKDGTSQTFLTTENVRAGFDPDVEYGNFADSNPYRCAFYIGNPCDNGDCRSGNVDYSKCNSGENRINSGLWAAEGSSPIPNSFHVGGVNMAYADGHVTFLSESVDGAIYAALATPQGLLLNETPLAEVVVSGGDF